MILTTVTASNVNLYATAGGVSLGTYTNATGLPMRVAFQCRLQQVDTATAQLFTFRYVHETAAGALKASMQTSWVKYAAANTTSGCDETPAITLANGEKVEFFAKSDSSADTTTPDATVDVIDCAVVSIARILNTALPAESVAGRDAAAFGKLLDVATPVLTAASVNQGADNNVILSNGTYGNSALNTAIGTRMASATLPVLGADNKVKISTDAQDLSTTFAVNAKTLNGNTPNNLAAGAAMTLTSAYNTAMANMDAAVSTRSTHSPADVVAAILAITTATVTALGSTLFWKRLLTFIGLTNNYAPPPAAAPTKEENGTAAAAAILVTPANKLATDDGGIVVFESQSVRDSMGLALSGSITPAVGSVDAQIAAVPSAAENAEEIEREGGPLDRIKAGRLDSLTVNGDGNYVDRYGTTYAFGPDGARTTTEIAP